MTTLVREDLSEAPLSILEERREVAQKDDASDPNTEDRIVITTYGFYSERVHTLFVSSILFLTSDAFMEAGGGDGDEKESRKNRSPESIIQDAFHSICGGQNSCKVEYIGSFYRLYVPDIETARKIARRIEDAVSNDDSDYDEIWRVIWRNQERLFLRPFWIIRCLSRPLSC